MPGNWPRAGNRLVSVNPPSLPASTGVPSQVPACGSFNWTILLLFDDGMEWIFRSPRKDGAIVSDETNLSLLASEAATLKYIKAKSTIPVPEVYAYRQALLSPPADRVNIEIAVLGTMMLVSPIS